MTSVRIKVIGQPPLPSIKVWFEISAAASRGATIHTLKTDLCRDVPAFADAGVRSDGILLEVDGFELLDVSSVSVIQPDDIVSVKETRPTGERGHALAKRKRENSPSGASKRQKTIASPDSLNTTLGLRPTASAPHNAAFSVSAPALSSSEKEQSSEGSESSEDSTAEESLDSASESDDDSDEESSPSSESNVAEVSTSGSQQLAQQLKPTVVSSLPLNGQHPLAISTPGTVQLHPPVPPGDGKTATHARNARRRKRKALLKVASVLPSQVSGAPQEDAVTSTPDENVNVLPYDTPPPEPVRISDGAPSFELVGTLTNRNKRKGFKKSMEGKFGQKTVFDSPSRRPRLIPPSERDDIPSNMFVTSVDCSLRETVHAGVNGNRVSEAHFMSNSVLDWDKIDQAWENLPRVEAVSNLKPGDTVAWKALALNQATFSPEIMLQIATVSAISEQGCTVVRALRADAQGEDEGDEESHEQPLDETFNEAEVGEAGWRHVVI